MLRRLWLWLGSVPTGLLFSDVIVSTITSANQSPVAGSKQDFMFGGVRDY